MNPQTTPQEAEPEVHDLARLFPAMPPDQFAALKADIEANGLLDPITVAEGQVVDGVHRLRACRELGVAPRSVEWDGQGSLLALVVGRNLHRRHLEQSQRAMLAAKIAGMSRGRPAKNARVKAVSQADAAQMAKVSRTSVQKARKVNEKGVPELARAVERGEVPLAAAARVAELDAAEQAEVVARGPAAIRACATPAHHPERAEAHGGGLTVSDDADAGPAGPDPAPVAVEPAGGVPIGPDDPVGDREWLESLPPRADLRDPTAFDREALIWRRAAPIIDQARLAPGFEAEIKHKRFFDLRPRLLVHLLGLEHPGHWNVCGLCGGAGLGAGPGRCMGCWGDGYKITRRDEG